MTLILSDRVIHGLPSFTGDPLHFRSVACPAPDEVVGCCTTCRREHVADAKLEDIEDSQERKYGDNGYCDDGDVAHCCAHDDDLAVRCCRGEEVERGLAADA